LGLKSQIKKANIFNSVTRRMNNLYARTDFVQKQLSKIPNDKKILDAGCGSQQFKKFTAHLEYFGQDFGQYINDDKKMIGGDTGGLGGTDGYEYGSLDYVGDVWNINETDGFFDCILCTEVFEHIPHPIKTLEEFSRLLKCGGTLILTAPSNSLRHMDPYFYYTGFTDRWFEKFLVENDFEIISCEPVGDYYSWLAVEMARTGLSHGWASKMLLFPAFCYYYFKKQNQLSTDTLCMGYHIVAKKTKCLNK